MNTADFQTQLTSIMEIMARTAVAEIGKLFEENSLLLRLEISRCTNENESLKKKCHFLENELKFGKMKRTAPSSSHPGLTVVMCVYELQTSDCLRWVSEDPPSAPILQLMAICNCGSSLGLCSYSIEITYTEHQPTIYNVFGKEWCMNLWRHEESNVGQKDDTHLNSSVNTEEPINLLDEEPDVIMINEETLKDDDCSRKNKPEEDESSSLRGAAVTSDERCVAQSSDDFITYTIPSDDQVQSNVHQTQAEEQPLDGMISTQGDSTTWSDLSPDVGFIPYNLNFNETVTPKKKFKCVFCGKTFEYLSHMTKHMRRHSGEKPYVCTVCGKRFAQKTYLTTHERTHSGERPYSCMECGKSFSQKSSLNVHLRSHTGEKPYSCSHCGKSYAFKIALKSHRC